MCYKRYTTELRLPFRGSNDGGQSYLGRILLVAHSWRLHRVRQDVSEVPRVQPTPSSETRGITQHDIPLVVRHMGNGHYRPILARQRPNETPIGHRGLLNKVDRGRAPSHHICQECPKFCMEEHSVSVWGAEHNRVQQRPTIYRSRPPDLL